ncbi:hypothetical protein J4446_01415 [Candidatus Woesearchaeota archaeon]|nr:hypothetical protein [Candidatus Woesearchaeota archaeon]
MKKKILKSGWIATAISVLSGFVNVIISLFNKGAVGSAQPIEQSIPWIQTLLIMAAVFILVFVVLLIYYFIIKKEIEKIPNP